jgi:hypothetical protein
MIIALIIVHVIKASDALIAILSQKGECVNSISGEVF